MADGPVREEVIVDVTIDEADAEKQLDTVTKRITKLKDENKELLKTNKELEKQGKANSKEYVENSKQIEINKQKIQQNNASQKSLITTLISEDKSIKALTARNRELIKQRNELSTATASGRAKIALLNREIDENTEIIRKNSSAHEKQRLNIGNYKSALDGLKPGLGSTIEQHGEMVTTMSKGALALGAAGVAAGALFAAYVKSSRGARDLAKAQDVLSSATEVVSESFGEWIADMTGQDGKGGIGILETLVTGLLIRLDSGVGIMASVRAQAKELLRELDISLKFAQAFYKEDERRAELQRRIRDDESRTITERLAAAAKVEKFMQNAGDRTIVVLQAQAQAIKDNTVNFAQNREAQLRVAEIEAEIADKREEITGKLTENAMAVQQLTREYAELQRTTRLEKLDAELQAAHELYLQDKERRDKLREEEEEIISRFNSRIVRETKDRIKKEQDAEKSALQYHEKVTNARIGFIDQLGNTLSVLAGKNKGLAIAAVLVEKVAAIAGIISNTAIANAKAIATSPLTFGQPWVGINTATAVAAGVSVAAQAASSVAQIAGFAEGGLSGTKIQPHHGKPIRRSNGDDRLATVKTGEVILNERQQRALGGDETFRRIGVPGFADGGFTGFAQTNEANRRVQQAIETRNLISLVNSVKTVLVLQDFEVAKAAKDSPIQKAQVL